MNNTDSMQMSRVWLAVLLTIVGVLLVQPAPAIDTPSPSLPNIVIIFTDDQGYQDVGCFGSPDIETPSLDRMAAEGMRFTDFHVAQAVCSASRAGLMTGCYSNRVGILGALRAQSRHGISDNELTMAEVAKQRGYATAIYGKWHLGHHPQFLPTRHGFDEYFGVPYSHDMGPKRIIGKDGRQNPPLPLIEGEKIFATEPDLSQLTTWYTERAVNFIERNKARPFLCYVAHSMPHVPLAVSDKFRGKSKRGLYGDVIMEIDWSVGQILDTLRRLNLAEKTWVVFTSDNGPWLAAGDNGGSALPLREGKNTAFEGGSRNPCIMWRPGTIPAGRVCKQLAATIDILPTIAALIGVELPKDRIIDGKDIRPLFEDRPDARGPHDFFYYYQTNELRAVRAGQWKLFLPHTYPSIETRLGGAGRQPVLVKNVQRKIGLELFDLENDISETTNVASLHPDVVQHLQTLVERAREDLGDSLTGRTGKNVRRPGQVSH